MNSISIIIAIFNRKDELFELLRSLSLQTDRDFEIIIVDDGSTEVLYPTVQLFETQLSIQYFKKANSGPGLSRNFGARKAKNEWLVFLDSDVIVEKNYVGNVKQNIASKPCDAFGGADKSHVDFNVIQKAISYSMTSIFTTGGIRGSKKAVTKFQPRSFNMGVRKSAFDEVGGFSELRIGEDPDLSMTLWEKGYTTIFFDDIGVYHKRRVDFGKFSKQVYQFGIARPILNQRHPNYVKLTFAFPSLFLVGFFLGLVEYFYMRKSILLALYGLYIWIVFLHSLWKNKSLSIASMSVISAFIQLFSYGYGFLKSWIRLNILRERPENAFPGHFYRQ